MPNNKGKGKSKGKSKGKGKSKSKSKGGARNAQDADGKRPAPAFTSGCADPRALHQRQAHSPVVRSEPAEAEADTHTHTYTCVHTHTHTHGARAHIYR